METKLWNKNYLLAFISIIFIFSNFYLLLSCMPLAVKESLQASSQQMSWIVSIYSLGIILFRPFSGFIADKFGKQIVSLIAFIFFTICSIAYLGTNSLYVILIIRFIHGIVHSLGTTAHAAMGVDFSPSNMKGQGIGYYGLAMCLSMVMGPALGLYILDNYDMQTLLIVAAGCSFVGTCITGFIKRDRGNVHEPGKTLKIKDLIEKAALPISFLSLLLSLSYCGILTFIAIYFKDLHIENGSIIFYIAFAISMIISRPFIGKIIDNKGAHYLITSALVLFSFGILCLAYANNISVVILTGLLLGISYGSVFSSFQTIAVQSCPATKSGSAMATFYLFYDLGFGTGAILLAQIADLTNYRIMYIFISIIILVMLAIYISFKKFKIF